MSTIDNNTSLAAIALIGISCEFAGDTPSPNDLWDALKESRDVGSAIPIGRFDLESFTAHMLNMDNNGQLRQKLLRTGYFIVEKLNGTKTSTHIGQFPTDHAIATIRMRPEHRSRFHGPNTLLYNASARLSYHFNLQGSNLSLDVTCLSSLRVLHMTVQCLRTNEADMAVCGGVNGIFAPESFLQSSLIGAQSPDGRSRPFSADANGYAKDDGLGFLLLKQLSDAERDGDPIEANCLDRFFNRSTLDPPLLLGSIKSNLGHTEDAAGVASIIKVAMCMYHRGITVNMQFTSLNPKLEAQKYNLHILQNFIPFPSVSNNEKIAIGVNSFGMVGSMTHSIIEEYQPINKTSIENGHIDENHIKSKQEYFILIFSKQINAFLTEQASPGLSIISRPTKLLAQKICFVFSGQGQQWWSMGRQLYESEPLFSKWINLIDGEMTKINKGDWRLLEELIEKKNEQESRINDTNIAQPPLFAIQVALAALLVSWNIYPSFIISHSGGDQAAAFVADRLSLKGTVRVLPLSMSEEEVENKLLKGIEHLACIAVVNSPRSVTISGDEKTIDEIQQVLSISYPNVFEADIRGFLIQDHQQIFHSTCAKAKLYSSVIGEQMNDNIPVDSQIPSWYESKDSSIQRLANRISTHPLLNIRQLNEQTSATWKNAIFFPIVAYLELATAACQQLLAPKEDDQQQPTIIFENVNFFKALILNKHELVEVFTQIIMPMREWYIIFCNQDNLNKYLLNQFTLYAQGKSEIDSKQQKSLTVPDRWTIQDIRSAYAHLPARAYQYESSFEKIKTVHAISTTVISQLSDDNNNCSSYYLLHPYQVLLPGVETIFLPVRILKSIYSSKTKTNQSANIEVCGNYYDNICGIGQEGTYSLDLWTFPMDNKIEEPIFTFEGAVIQQVQGAHSGRWSMEQTIYDKLNLTTDLPNKDHKLYLNTIIKDYCMKRVSIDSPIIKDKSGLLPSPNRILNNQLNSIINQDLIESIEPLNELAAYYAQIAVKDLDLNHIHHLLLNACRSLASNLHSEQAVTWHSTQLRLIQLSERFPRLKSFLIILNKYGLHLKDILNGEKNGLDIFVYDDEIEQIFHSICQYLQLQYKQQQTKDNSFEKYRLRIFLLTDSGCSDVLPILDLFFSLSQQTRLLIDLHYADSNPTQLANAQQTFNTHITNQTIDFYDSKTLEKTPIESFDIIFSANQLQENQDLTSCLIDLRRLLVPNGLLLLLELVHVPLHFDVIFGFFDQ
ncbi:unnamed protein product [Adineta steineri]|uniref:Ketosynthase family 3 (KS3) domain-containing protein n=1 Tax=Adineta steineri TaxID=433720 RepID=A0A815IM24_9BILA|nr:unnamed protein product [Adineta steineri]CAF1602906.1 unnamed protein product [Adineta steineri]